VFTAWAGQPARWRPLPAIGEMGDSPHSRAARENAWRAAVNTPIQGQAADYATASLWPIIEWIDEDAVPAAVVCTVHDSIVLEVREDCVQEVAWNVRRVMTGHASGDVPLAVDFKSGSTWGSMKELKVS
jgi:DNA polymerase-1